MNTGISKIILPELSLEEFFKLSSKAGYDTVELCIEKEGKGELTLEKQDTAVPYILDLSKKYDLPVVSLVHWQCSGNLLEKGELQKASIEETIKGLYTARSMEVRCTLHTLGHLHPDLYYDEAYENAVSALKTIAKVAENLRVSLAVEFVWNGFLFSPLEMKRFLEDVGSEYVGFYFDPGNMAVFHYPHHWVRILGPYIKMVHLKDWQGNALNGGWPALLKGNVDFVKVVKELHSAGYDGPMISEVSIQDASLEETKKSIQKIVRM